MKLLRNKLFLGALCMVVAAVIAFAVLPRFYKSQAETTNVVRVTQDVPKGTTLTKSMLTISEVGAYGLSEKTVRSEDDAVGKIAAENLYEGEYLSSNRIAAPEEYNKWNNAEASDLSGDNCLITIKFPSASSGIAGILRAGNIVDIFECAENEEGLNVTEKRMESMYVYSVMNKDLESLNELDEKKSKMLEEDADYDFEPAYVVFRCTESQAQELIRLEKEESLHLTLRRTEG